MAYNFLLTAWGSAGNLSPLLTAARQMRRAGHHARILGDPAVRAEVEAAGFGFSSWRRAPVGPDADPSDFSDMAKWMQQAIIDPLADYAADVIEELRRVPTHAVLTVDLLFGVVLGAKAAGVPVAMFSPHISVRPLPGLPPAGTGLSLPVTEQERAAVDAARHQRTTVMNDGLDSMNEVCARLGVEPLPDGVAIYDRADRLLLAISQAFDFRADSLPDNLRYVGPLLDEPGWAEPWQPTWAGKATQPRVLVTCSTGAQEQTMLLQRILDAVGLLPVDAVATTGPNIAMHTIRAPANVQVLRGARHEAIMPHMSLVVSHGGHGTVCRTLLNGLPSLVLPNGRDQGDNAARIEHNGAGLRLPVTASAEDIAATITRLIDDPSFRRAAKRLGSAIRADIDRSRIVCEMEAIAAPTASAARRSGAAVYAG